MSTQLQAQPVEQAPVAADLGRVDRPGVWRRAIAGPAGLALLLAGGGLMVRVLLLALQQQGFSVHAPMLYTGIACVLAGVALLLIALPKIVSADGGDERPTPEFG